MAIPRNLANIAPHVAGSSGGITGLTFNATQSASAGANTLDDYEEGTFTPVLKCDTTAATASTANATYIKVGALVHCDITLNLSSLNGGTGNVTITDLPFTSTNVVGTYRASPTVGYFSGTSGPTVIGGIIINNVSYIELNYDLGTSLTHSQISAASVIRLSITYRV